MLPPNSLIGVVQGVRMEWLFGVLLNVQSPEESVGGEIGVSADIEVSSSGNYFNIHLVANYLSGVWGSR